MEKVQSYRVYPAGTEQITLKVEMEKGQALDLAMKELNHVFQLTDVQADANGDVRVVLTPF